MKTYKGKIINNSLPENAIYVFGSNTQGRHGKGSALTAKLYFGAIYGQPRGIQGRSYAIVTKNLQRLTHPSIPEGIIIEQIKDFYIYATLHSNNEFYIAYTGHGKNLSGYTNQEMAEFFNMWGINGIPSNIIFEEDFAKLMN